MATDVLLGFSGGIDSTACVSILREEGYRVTALYIDTLGDENALTKVVAKAKDLDLELIIVDKTKEFEQKIINYFCSSYLVGNTPAPCTVCNSEIKWHTLWEIAQQKGIEKIATGHYFSITEHNNHLYVERGADPIKDQSYYLWNIPKHLLPHIVTPMAKRIKAEVKAEFAMQGAKESMGVCFLSGLSYIDFLKKRHPNIAQKGLIINSLAQEIGSHDGFPYYTIGQKKGLNIQDKSKNYCITKIDAQTNTLTCGEDRDLWHYNLVLDNFNLIDPSELDLDNDYSVMIRGIGRNPEGSAKITIEGNTLKIRLENPAWALALGQPTTIYCEKRVIGGGFLINYY